MLDIAKEELSLNALGVKINIQGAGPDSHMLLPLTSFAPGGHKRPRECTLRASSQECAIYMATPGSMYKRALSVDEYSDEPTATKTGTGEGAEESDQEEK